PCPCTTSHDHRPTKVRPMGTPPHRPRGRGDSSSGDEGSPAGRGWPSGWGGLVPRGWCYWAQPWGLGGVASVRFTALPRLAVVPAVGLWRMTVPGGNEQLP